MPAAPESSRRPESWRRSPDRWRLLRFESREKSRPSEMPEERPPAISTKNHIAAAGVRRDWPSPEPEINSLRQKARGQRQSRLDETEGVFRTIPRAQTEPLR